MFRTLSGGLRRFLAARSTSRPKPTRFRLEPLEERKMLDAAYINEIYLDPPGGLDANSEYIELRGTPGMSLDNTYLLIVENENNVLNTGNPGDVERIFDLSGESMGSNGFLTLRQAGSPYSVAPGTTDLTYTGVLENSGFTAMLIQTDGSPANTPVLNMDLDAGNDGLDVANGHAGWTVLDSIGIFSEAGEAQYGRLYGQINFGPEPASNIEPGTSYVNVGFEIEYAARWGNSTGQTADDWDVSNLTDSVMSGYTGAGDFRQSTGDPQGSGTLEASQNIPYGTNLTNTLGAPNLGPAADIYINEIYFDPPGGLDVNSEYIELRGTPNKSLDGIFLILVENEDNIFNNGHSGELDRVFDLSGYTLGSNGYLILRQAGNPYTVAPGTTELTYTGVIENSGFTALLIKNNGDSSSDPYVDDLAPLDLDVDADGALDVASGEIDWDILDSIGIHSEAGESEYGKLYGMINFGDGPNGIPTANYHDVGFEIEYIARYGNSTGSAEADWDVSNLTDNPLSGYTGYGDFRQSTGDPQGSGPIESSQNIPYGTNLTNTLGASNYPNSAAPTIVNRQIFYNGSKFDSYDASAGASDDAAIATDKTPYFAGDGVAQPQNVTSYVLGINGIMIDVDGLTSTISASDFTFRMGATNSPDTWATAPDPTSIIVRSGAGDGGSDRIDLVWPDHSLENTYLQVTFEGNDAAGGFNTNTHLAASDVFYFGNLVGDELIGPPPVAFTTNAADEIDARLNSGYNLPITNALDFDRNQLINANDQVIARLHSAYLIRINIPVPGALPEAAAPLAAAPSDDSTSAVASSLTVPSSAAPARRPSLAGPPGEHRPEHGADRPVVHPAG